MELNQRGNPKGWDTRDEMVLSRLAAWEPDVQALHVDATYSRQNQMRESAILAVFGRDDDPDFDIWILNRLHAKRGEL